jgi:hypothetical protein
MEIDLARIQLSINVQPSLSHLPLFSSSFSSPIYMYSPFVAGSSSKSNSLTLVQPYFGASLQSVFNRMQIVVNHIKEVVINRSCKTIWLVRPGLEQGLFTFKKGVRQTVPHTNSLMKTLITYTCKNIFVHFSLKPIYSQIIYTIRRLTASKILQTTTI